MDDASLPEQNYRRDPQSYCEDIAKRAELGKAGGYYERQFMKACVCLREIEDENDNKLSMRDMQAFNSIVRPQLHALMKTLFGPD